MFEGGQKGAIVELFGWPYRDIEQECATFLGKAGYLGVKIAPPQGIQRVLDVSAPMTSCGFFQIS
jgi:hypothetical protein